MDSEIFFSVHLRRILNPAGARPTVADLEKAFDKWIQSRSSNASNGQPPADYKTLLAEATDGAVAVMAAELQETKGKLAKVEATMSNANTTGPRQNSGGNVNYASGSANTGFNQGGGGGGGGGRGRGGNNQRKRKRGGGQRGGGQGNQGGGGGSNQGGNGPQGNSGGGGQGGGRNRNSPQTNSGQPPQVTYCWKFNDPSGCPVSPAGKTKTSSRCPDLTNLFPFQVGSAPSLANTSSTGAARTWVEA